MMRKNALLSINGWDETLWRDSFINALSDFNLITPQQEHNPQTIEYAFVWKPPLGQLKAYQNLKVIFCLGAGVDALLLDKDLPNVPIARVVDPSLTQQMTQWVVWQCLHHFRQGTLYAKQQSQNVWQDHRTQPLAQDVTIGMMGVGELGLSAAKALQSLGFNVAGWSREPKINDSFKIYAGQNNLTSFLNQTHILVSLLPLTEQTKGILNLDLLTQLNQKHSFAPILINAGRGGLQVENDIIFALENGILKGASLDVFETEPLPQTSKLWQQENVIITPHNSAVSNPKAIVALVKEQIERLNKKLPLLYLIDKVRGY